MSPDKARDLFSSYHEGSLDPGLRQALERSFEQDPTLKADYDRFSVTMDRLGVLADEEIEIPSFLSDRIATRLEGARDKKRAPWFSPLLLRNFAFGGLGLALLVAGVMTFGQMGRQATSGTGIADVLEVNVKNGEVLVDYIAQTRHTVVIKSDNQEVDRQDLDRQRSLTSLTNSRNPRAVIFEIQANGIGEAIRIAVPGTRTLEAAEGRGSIDDLARAMADFYRMPVRIDAKKDGEVVWQFEPKDLPAFSTRLQTEQGISADVMANGLVTLK